ncbi:MAG: redoxin domain-containing protein [Pirellulaceae bacterium]|nr:redoxin domain-containing protein [Pirellulaceae bacterium]
MKPLSLFLIAVLTVYSAQAFAHEPGSVLAEEGGQADPGTPAEQCAALLREYRPVSGGMRKAKTDLERKAAVERIGTFPAKFVELAEKNPRDPVALEILRQAVQALGTTDSAAQIAWQMNRSDFPAGSTDDSAGKTVTLLLRDHVLSDKLAPVVDRMRYSYRMESEEFLSTVLRVNPHRDVQAVACLALAQFLYDRLRMLQLAEDRPELTKHYEAVFGKEYLPGLQRLGRAKLARRIETLFERAAGEYGDVKIRVGTVGAQAKAALYDIRHLSLGKLAPDIEGQDQDGRQFKLSDYRGKVVLLYFWSEY